MDNRLLRRISPGAQRSLMQSQPGDVVAALVEIKATTNLDALRDAVEHMGGRIGTALRSTGVVRIDIPAGRVSEVAALDGVAYIESAQPYRA